MRAVPFFKSDEHAGRLYVARTADTNRPAAAALCSHVLGTRRLNIGRETSVLKLS